MNYFNDSISEEGINYYHNEPDESESKWKNYRTRFLYFHNSPMVKMSYHFVSKYKNLVTND